MAAKNGHWPSYEKRARPLRVSGVGNGSQECTYDCKLPVAFRLAGEAQGGGQQTNALSIGQLTTPAVKGSDLPGLLGLTALRKNRAILDFNTLKLHFCGPGDYEIERGLPTGTDSYQLEVAPSGHLVLPCCEYTPGSTSTEHSLTLMARTSNNKRPRVPPPPSAPPVLDHLKGSEQPVPQPPVREL